MAEDEIQSKRVYIKAGGGLLESRRDGALRIAVLHRNRYRDRDGSRGDWVLPKGKCEPGESFKETALREVREETGCRARITGPAFPSEYLAGGRPKLVMFFRMECVQDGDLHDLSEVQEVRWLTPEEALGLLTYETERDVVRLAYAQGLPAPY